MIDAGRPTKYKKSFAKQSQKLCLLGAIDKDLASFFEVNEDTINEWKKVHKDFSESIKEGKMIADAEVAKSLYQRAVGYQHKDVDIKIYKGKIIKTPLIKHYPPDSVAGMFWMKNRRPTDWRDKQEIDHTTDGLPITLVSYRKNAEPKD